MCLKKIKSESFTTNLYKCPLCRNIIYFKNSHENENLTGPSYANLSEDLSTSTGLTNPNILNTINQPNISIINSSGPISIIQTSDSSPYQRKVFIIFFKIILICICFLFSISPILIIVIIYF